MGGEGEGTVGNAERRMGVVDASLHIHEQLNIKQRRGPGWGSFTGIADGTGHVLDRITILHR